MSSKNDAQPPPKAARLVDAEVACRDMHPAHWTPALYRELRSLARSQRLGASGFGNGTTSIVHEAWLRLSHGKGIEIEHRGRFFALAAKVMRSVLVDNARRQGASRRGGDRLQVDLDQAHLVSAVRDDDLLALDRILVRLEQLDQRLADVVTCRFYGGLSLVETADALGCSTATVKRNWRLARSWLYNELVREGAA